MLQRKGLSLVYVGHLLFTFSKFACISWYVMTYVLLLFNMRPGQVYEYLHEHFNDLI